jgi:hypothetical protein
MLWLDPCGEGCPLCDSEDVREEFTDFSAGVHQMCCDSCDGVYEVPISGIMEADDD